MTIIYCPLMLSHGLSDDISERQRCTCLEQRCAFWEITGEDTGICGVEMLVLDIKRGADAWQYIARTRGYRP